MFTFHKICHFTYNIMVKKIELLFSKLYDDHDGDVSNKFGLNVGTHLKCNFL